MEDLRLQKINKVLERITSASMLVRRLRTAGIVLCVLTLVVIMVSLLPNAVVPENLWLIFLVPGVLVVCFAWGVGYLINRIMKGIKEVEDKVEKKSG